MTYIEREKQRRLEEANSVDWRSLSCPYCHAVAGSNCTDPKNAKNVPDRNAIPHPGRIRAAQEKLRRAQWELERPARERREADERARRIQREVEYENERRRVKVTKPKKKTNGDEERTVSNTYQTVWQVAWTHGEQPNEPPTAGCKPIGEWFPYHGSGDRVCWRRPLARDPTFVSPSLWG